MTIPFVSPRSSRRTCAPASDTLDVGLSEFVRQAIAEKLEREPQAKDRLRTLAEVLQVPW